MLDFGRIELFLLICLQLMAVCNANCDGEHKYLKEDGKCEICEMCTPGSEPIKVLCGYGQKDPEYACKACDKGSYSNERSYNQCKTCTQCENLNSHYRHRCTAEADAVCGECYSNYYRLKKADGMLDLECQPCAPTSELAECKEKPVSPIVVPILASVAGIVITIAAIFCGRMIWKRWKKNHKKTFSKGKPGSLLNAQSIESSTSASASFEPLNKPSSSQSVLKQPNVTVKSSLSPTYSNLPTAEYNSTLLKKEISVDFHPVTEEAESYDIEVHAFDTSSLKRQPEKVETDGGVVAYPVS